MSGAQGAPYTAQAGSLRYQPFSEQAKRLLQLFFRKQKTSYLMQGTIINKNHRRPRHRHMAFALPKGVALLLSLPLKFAL